MNKLSALFIVIIIILAVVLGISIKTCISYQRNLDAAEEQFETIMKAVENSGFKLEENSDGTMTLIVE